MQEPHEPHGSSGAERCAVCQDALQEAGAAAAVTQLECGHEFHTHCILGWFRSLQSRCPLCLRTGASYVLDNDEEEESGHRADMREIVRFAAAPDAPLWLKCKLRALRAARQKLAEHRRELQLFKRLAVPAGTLYAEAFKHVRAKQTKVMAAYRRVWRMERLLCRRVRVTTVVITRQRAAPSAPSRRSSRLAAAH
jgi:hypothetical protein